MTNRRFAHALARWSVLAGLLVAGFWGVWMQLAPLPAYQKPWEHPRLWWLDAVLIVVVINMVGWAIRFINQNYAINDGAFISVIISLIIGTVVGLVVGKVFGGHAIAIVGAASGAITGIVVGKALYRIFVGVVGGVACICIGIVVGRALGGDAGAVVGGASGYVFGWAILLARKPLLNFLNARNIT